MEFACLLMLFLLCGLSQQAPKQLIRRGNISSTSVIIDENKAEEKEANLLSKKVENLFTGQLTHRRQNVIDLVRNLTPTSAAAKSEPRLEKHSTIGKVPDISKDVQNDVYISDIKRDDYAEHSEQYSKDGFDSSGSSEDDKRNEDDYQDEDQSGDEDTKAINDEPNTSGDSVAAFIKTDSVSGTARDVISSDKMSAERDPVASYVAWSSKQERKGNVRDVIEESEDVDQSASPDHDYVDPDKVASTVVNSNRRDSVASYITAAASEVKDKISTVESKMNTDSVSTYNDILGSYKNNIAINESHEGNPDNPAEKGNMKGPGSGEAVDDDAGDENEVSETVAGDNSAEDDEVSGEDNFHSSKTQAILEGLEEDLSEESTSSGVRLKEKSGQTDELRLRKSHLKKTQDQSSSYVVQQPYGIPIQYNMPQYTVPQYMYVSIKNAEKKGAVCLDGSTPGYFYRRGVGIGERNWIIYLQGGAWCDSKEDCYERSESNLGSSLKFTYLHNAEGLLSRDEAKNPDFYNWNVVYVPYCDGASYTGNRSHPVVVRGRMIYFRGKRVLSALIDDLLDHGLSDSQKVVFSGTSAGGLAVLLNADYVRSRIPTNVNVYSLADAGIFLDINDKKGKSLFADSMKAVYELHQSSGSINPKCKARQSKKAEWKCLFPYYFGEYIQTPMFIVNPLHDSWQLANVVGIHCAYKPNKCDKKEMKAVKTFREQTLKALNPFMKNSHVGIFADGCVDHGQIVFSPKWTKIRVKNRSMSGTFVRWMKKEESVKSVIDLQADQYPFNPTCVSHFHG